MARLQRGIEAELAAHPDFSAAAAGASIGLVLYPQDSQSEAEPDTRLQTAG